MCCGLVFVEEINRMCARKSWGGEGTTKVREYDTCGEMHAVTIPRRRAEVVSFLESSTTVQWPTLD